MGPDVTKGRGAAPSAAATNFAASFAFLPAPRRAALAAVYAFCRETDDIADGGGTPEEKSARLASWKEDLDRALAGGQAAPVLAALAEAASGYGIPRRHFDDLLRGVGMDIGPVRFRTFTELEEYCTLVASAVGLMCLDIFGRRNERTERYAREVGIALQLTNIIRDVAPDASMGRLYLPLDDCARFDCPADGILARRDSPELRRLLGFEASRAEEYYRRASAALDPSDLPAMRPARIMQETYRILLRKMRRSSFDVLGRRASVSRLRRLIVALRSGLGGGARLR